MNKRWLTSILLLLSCSSKDSNLQKLDLQAFSISIPKQWHYRKEQGIDSFVGEISGPKVSLFFDYSDMGYAGHLDESLEENIHIDSTNNFVTKIIWPKIIGKGITGIYIHSRKSSLNFQMNGKNLSARDQELALKAFKTIQLKINKS